jgi:hypothetical protein
MQINALNYRHILHNSISELHDSHFLDRFDLKKPLKN